MFPAMLEMFRTLLRISALSDLPTLLLGPFIPEHLEDLALR